MAVGQIGFHKEKLRKYVIVQRDLTVLNRLKKTMRERTDVDFQGERLARDKLMNSKLRSVKRQEDALVRQIQLANLTAKEEASYDRVFNAANMQVNADIQMSIEDYEDSFM